MINIITVKQKPTEDNGMLPHIETRDPVFQIHAIYPNINFLIDFLPLNCFSNFRKKNLVYKQEVKNWTLIVSTLCPEVFLEISSLPYSSNSYI